MAKATAAAVEWRGRASSGRGSDCPRFEGQQLVVEFESSRAVAGLSQEPGPRQAWSQAESRAEPGIERPGGFVLGTDFRMSV